VFRRLPLSSYPLLHPIRKAPDPRSVTLQDEDIAPDRKVTDFRLISGVSGSGPRRSWNAASGSVRPVNGAGHTVHREDFDGFITSLDGWIRGALP
jgi:hypothetical protein